MIDEEKLLKSIQYSNRWNNTKCPDWVIGIIKAQAKTDAVLISLDNAPEITVHGDPLVKELFRQWKALNEWKAMNGWEK